MCGSHWLTALFRYPSVIFYFPIHKNTSANFLDYTLILKATSLIERLISLSLSLPLSLSLSDCLPLSRRNSPYRLYLHHDVPRPHSRQITLSTTPLVDRQAHRRKLYLTKHEISNRQTSKPQRDLNPQSL